MLGDVRFAVRMLLKRPGFTVIAALTLALGIGATAAVYRLVQGVLLTPPPYRDPDRLVLVPSVRIDSQQVERIEAIHQSCRSVTIGSIRAARMAGRDAAPMHEASTNRMPAAYGTISNGFIMSR